MRRMKRKWAGLGDWLDRDVREGSGATEALGLRDQGPWCH